MRGSHFAPGAWTLWIGPPRVGQPSCVPDDAVALETVQVGASGNFSHGFTMREDFGGGWQLLANGYARLYAAPGVDRCGTPPGVTSLSLPGYRGAIPSQLAASACPASSGETSPSALLTFFAPHAARVGQVVPVVLHVPIADSCYSACAGTATVDPATRTVRLGVSVFRQSGIGCLASGSEAATEMAFTLDAPGTWTIEAPVTVGWPAGNSQEHLTVEKTGDYQARGRWTMTVRP